MKNSTNSNITNSTDRTELWIARVRMALIIIALILISVMIVHGEAIMDWLSEELMGSTHSQLQDLLN